MKDLKPVVVISGAAQYLERINCASSDYKEVDIQNLCFTTPDLLPVYEIDSSAESQIPLCTELSTKSGYVDILFVDIKGVLTVVECKLYRNPEAKRNVIGQIFDYAKDLVRFDYNSLEKQILKRRKDKSSLFEIVTEKYPDIYEDEFKNKVTDNLKHGRFRLLIVGDKIKDDVQDFISFFNKYSKMDFNLGIIELQLFRLPKNESILAVPLCLAKTVEYPLYKLEEYKSVEYENPDYNDDRKNNFSMFYEKLKTSIGTAAADEAVEFIDSLCRECSLVQKIGRGKKYISLSVKTDDEETNLFSIVDTGTLKFFGLTYDSLPECTRNNGFDYINSFCRLTDSVPCIEKGGWTVRPKLNGKPLKINDCMKIKNEWVLLIEEYIKRDNQIKAETILE